MTHDKNELDAIIEKAAHAVRDEQTDASAIEDSGARVWARIAAHAAENSSAEKSYSEGIHTMQNEKEQIRSCGDFQSLIPAYLDGKLSTARRLLLEDHSNECISCRKEMKAQRNLSAAKAATYVAPTHSPRSKARATGRSISRTGIVRWSLAAAVVLCVGIAGLFMYERIDLSGRTMAATLDSVNGEAYVVSDSQTRQLSAGEQLQKGEHLRTAKNSNALLRLADGSTVEMRERSEFSVSENMRGVTLKLDRGDVIVEAAKQGSGHLYVETPDSLVSVKGTIFAVESGTKGSRVSVVEGEVKVNHGGKDETLQPGEQTTTSSTLEKIPVGENVAWSRNAARYAGIISGIAGLKKEIDQKVPRPGVRHSSRFLDLVSENTVFYAAMPNLSETLAKSQAILQQRISQNPALAEWWKGKHQGISPEIMAQIQEFGSQLGDEIVVTAQMNAKGEPDGILVLGEVKDAAAFRTYVDAQLQKVAAQTGDMPKVRVVDDPATAKAPTSDAKDGSKSDLFVWINNGIFAASPEIESLRAFAATMNAPQANRFVSSPFHQRIADVYRDGAGLVIAADLSRIVSQATARDTSPDAAQNLAGLKQLGVTDLQDFVAEQKDVEGKTLSKAALTFSESDHGIPSWLAAPGPMGALDFISSNANVAAAFVVKKPTLLVDDLLGFLGTVQPEVREQMKEIEKQQGISLRDDLAAPLGGEFAFAVDGPILPTPSWKIILEVYDEAKLESTFERAIEKLNSFSMLHGKGKLALETASSGGRTYYTIKSDTGLEFNYMYVGGYLVAAPTRALLEQTIRNRDAGNTLTRSPRFLSSLPADGNTNFSAILYHDLAPLLGSLAEKMKGTAQGRQLASIDPNAPPTLAYAYAEGNRITVAANTEGGPFGLSPANLIGVPNSFEMQHILMNALDDKDVKKEE